MKKIAVFCLLMAVGALSAINVNAQKFALIDMEYILKSIPAYEMANDQLNTASKKWELEVDAIQKEAQAMYKTYQADLVFLSPEMKTKREAEIVAKEQEAQELKRKYFGQNGELFKKRESLIKPIQDEIYTAVKEVAQERGYAAIVDRSSAMSIIFASPQIDVSKEVLAKLGY
jgi:outer membrane protein